MANNLFGNILSKFFPKAPESLPSGEALETFKFQEIDFQTKKGKKLLYTLFRRYPVIFQALTLRASLGVPSISFKTDNPKAEKVLAKFLSNLHPSSPNLYLTSFLRDLWLDTEIFGTSFIDPLWDKKRMNYLGFKKIHPISIDLLREHGEGSKVKLDPIGNPIGWVQEIESKKKELTYRDISYLTFITIGDEFLGISRLEPIYKTIWRLMNIEEGIATAIFRHGFPLYDIQVSGGVEGKPPTKEQLDSAANSVKGLNYKSEFIHPPNYKVKLLEAFSLGKGDDYTSNFIDLVSSVSSIPKYLLMGTAKELSRASASELLKMVKPGLIPSQQKLKLFFEEQVLAPLMKANHIMDVPELVFGEAPLFTDAKEKLSEFELSEEEKLPGLYLVSPHANLIYEGEKKQIVKSEHGMKMLRNYVGRKMYLVSDNKVYGIIKLREPREISINDFIQLRYAHRISDEERKEWWPKDKKLFVYEFDIIKMFPKLKKFEVPKGVQTIIQEVIPE